jgi:hypothetical protein
MKFEKNPKMVQQLFTPNDDLFLSRFFPAILAIESEMFHLFKETWCSVCLAFGRRTTCEQAIAATPADLDRQWHQPDAWRRIRRRGLASWRLVSVMSGRPICARLA